MGLCRRTQQCCLCQKDIVIYIWYFRCFQEYKKVDKLAGRYKIYAACYYRYQTAKFASFFPFYQISLSILVFAATGQKAYTSKLLLFIWNKINIWKLYFTTERWPSNQTFLFGHFSFWSRLFFSLCEKNTQGER